MLIDNGTLQVRWCDGNDPGHPGEYIVHVDGASHDNFILPGFSRRIADLLGDDWNVSNRGTRIEINHRHRWLHHDHDRISVAVEAAAASLAAAGMPLLTH